MSWVQVRAVLYLGLLAGLIFSSVVGMAQTISGLYGKGRVLKVGLGPNSTQYLTGKDLLAIDYKNQLVVTMDTHGRCQSLPFGASQQESKGKLELQWQNSLEEIFAEVMILEGPVPVPGRTPLQELQLQFAPRAMLSRKVTDAQLQWRGVIFTPGFLSLRLTREDDAWPSDFSQPRDEAFELYPLLKLLDPVGLDAIAGGRVVAVSWQSGPWAELAVNMLTEEEALAERARFCLVSSPDGIKDTRPQGRKE